MKSYLSLIRISAKVRKRQNRMTLLCIVFAVFLVTGIFSVADMFIRAETMKTKETHGYWHIRFENITESDAQTIGSRPDVAAASWYDVVNLDMSRDYFISGRQTALCGIEEMFKTSIMSYFPEDSSIQGDNEVILTPNAKTLLGVDIGGSVILSTPAGSYELRVTGFRNGNERYQGSNGGETTALLVEEGQVGVFMNIKTFRKILSENNDNGDPSYYVQFGPHANMRKALKELKEQYGLLGADIEYNSLLMGLMGLSDNTMFKTVYPLILVLFLLILLAGVLMISGSMNSAIAQRTQFFGMMRCIGMSKQQVVNFVRLEALNWCKTAVPAGIILGMVASWGICAILHYVIRGEFVDVPVFGVSLVGIVFGGLMGFLTVLIAARSPAKRASRVSPVAAVSGETGGTGNIRHHASSRFSNIETALGVSHATSAKKNLILMAGSFSLSIILFLSFSVLVQALEVVLPSKSYAPDLSISTSEFSNVISFEIAERIKNMSGVTQVLGRMYKPDIPAEFSAETTETTADLISYDDFQFDCLLKDKDLRKGSELSKVYGDKGYVLSIWDKDVPLEIGDKVQLGDSEVEIAGMLKYSPFSNSGQTGGEVILICSEQTFTRLTGIESYGVIDVQLDHDVSDEEVTAIHDIVRGKFEFRDRREEADRSDFIAFSLFVYGFLAIIALITVLNIVNSISMSVSARTRQYGAMRAVGMDGSQLTRMIAAEAVTYALIGCAVGCAAGLPLNMLLYKRVITSNYPYFTWTPPVGALLIILAFGFISTVAAVYAPSKRILDMPVTETINEL